MLRFGYCTNGFAYHPLPIAIDILAELGYESVAITLDYHALNPRRPGLARKVDRLRKQLARRHLHSVIETGARFLLDPRHKHQPTLISPTPEARKLRMDFLKKAVDVASDMGSDALSFWSGAAAGQAPREVQMKLLAESCRELCRHAEPRGMKLAFEPEPGMFIDRMSTFAELDALVGMPNFGLTLDVGHLICQGETPIGDQMRTWHNRIYNIHIEDMRPGVHDHLMFGEGTLDLPSIIGALTEIGYPRGVHVELSRHSHDAVETAQRALECLRRASQAAGNRR